MYLQTSPERTVDPPERVPERSVEFMSVYIMGAQPEAEHDPKAFVYQEDPTNPAAGAFFRAWREFDRYGVELNIDTQTRVCLLATQEARRALDIPTGKLLKVPLRFRSLPEVVWAAIAQDYEDRAAD